MIIQKNNMINLLFALFLSISCNARQIRIGIIDSGFDTEKYHAKICKDGLFDLTVDFHKSSIKVKKMTDSIGHGNNIVGIIADKLKEIDYCLYIIKIYKTDMKTFDLPWHVYLAAYKILYLKNVDIINVSLGGKDSNKKEQELIKLLVESGIKFVAASGNEGKNLDELCNIYPACYDDVIVVGNLTDKGVRHPNSNYGIRVDQWRKGTNLCYNDSCYSGSSQSTASYTADLALEIYKNEK